MEPKGGDGERDGLFRGLVARGSTKWSRAAWSIPAFGHAGGQQRGQQGEGDPL